MPKKKPSFLAAVQSLPPRKRASFFEQLPADLQKELLELRDLYRAGKLPSHVSAVRILEELKSRVAVKIAVTTFREWLQGVR